MDKDEKLLGFLAIQSDRVARHGDKIWEEMKHFSWALYILLGATLLFKFSWNVDTIWLIIFPFLACVVAVIAILSIHKEGKDFLDALGTILSIEKRLGFHDEDNEKNDTKMLVSNYRKFMLYIKNPIEKNIIDKFIEKDSLIKLNIRSLFIFYFIILFVIGLAEILWLVWQSWIN